MRLLDLQEDTLPCNHYSVILVHVDIASTSTAKKPGIVYETYSR